MKKATFKGATLLYPLPSVMVSCGKGDEANIITIAWTGIINSEPPMTYISVRPERFSRPILEKEMEFVINIPGENLTFENDFCGCTTGAKINKWEEAKLTKIPADQVSCPMIEECPINLECKVTEIKHLPSHDMFMAEIVAVHADENLLNENGKLELEKASLLTLVHGGYHAVSKKSLGKMGYSVMKPSTKKKLRKEGKYVGGKAPHKKEE